MCYSFIAISIETMKYMITPKKKKPLIYNEVKVLVWENLAREIKILQKASVAKSVGTLCLKNNDINHTPVQAHIQAHLQAHLVAITDFHVVIFGMERQLTCISILHSVWSRSCLSSFPTGRPVFDAIVLR